MLMLRCVFVLIYLVACSDSLVASNQEKAPISNASFVCALYRQKDLTVDDVSMPEVLTFCACSVVHENWVLTARKCYVQLDWYVTALEQPFTNTLPTTRHSIERVLDFRELSLVRVRPGFAVGPVRLGTTLQPTNTTFECTLLGLSTAGGGAPVSGNAHNLLYRVWHMEGGVLQARVVAMLNDLCLQKHGVRLSPYLPWVSGCTICIEPLTGQIIEPCTFDRGAPLICDGALYGVLLFDRATPRGLPMHLPAGCYGLNYWTSLHVEGISCYQSWITHNINT